MFITTLSVFCVVREPYVLETCTRDSTKHIKRITNKQIWLFMKGF